MRIHLNPVTAKSLIERAEKLSWLDEGFDDARVVLDVKGLGVQVIACSAIAPNQAVFTNHKGDVVRIINLEETDG